MIYASQIVRAAREWLDVPYHHQARVRSGVDCVGLLVVVGRAIGVVADDFDYTRYGSHPTGTLERLLTEHLVPLPSPEPGAVVSMRWGRDSHHVGIVGEYAGRLTLIHAHRKHGKVVEHTLDARWLKRVVSAYSYPGMVRAGASPAGAAR